MSLNGFSLSRLLPALRGGLALDFAPVPLDQNMLVWPVVADVAVPVHIAAAIWEPSGWKRLIFVVLLYLFPSSLSR